MIEILLTIGVVLLFLIWIRLAKVVQAIAELGGHLGRQLEQLVVPMGKLNSHLETANSHLGDIREEIVDGSWNDEEGE